MSDESTVSRSKDGDRSLVLVVVLDDETRRVPLPPVGAVVLGRGDDAQVRIDSGSVSRRHAAFTVAPDGGVTVEDLDSHNGTRIGGVAVAPKTPISLRVGDVVECGGVMVLLARAAAGGATARRALVVSDDARRFQRDDGDAVNLGRRGALRLLLGELVQRRIDAPGTALSVDEMFAAGWPDERISRESAQARVYTSVQRLRALGVGDLLITRGDGYLLDPEADVRRG